MKLKTRLARGCTGTQYYRRFRNRERRAYLWAMNLKPGDVINSFDGWNHEVKEVNIHWVNFAEWNLFSVGPKTYRKLGFDPNSNGCPIIDGRKCAGEFVYEVEIISTEGWRHCISETGCIVPAYPVEVVVAEKGQDLFDLLVSFGHVDSRGVQIKSPYDNLSEEQKQEIACLPKYKVPTDLKWPELNYPPLSFYKKKKRKQ